MLVWIYRQASSSPVHLSRASRLTAVYAWSLGLQGTLSISLLFFLSRERTKVQEMLGSEDRRAYELGLAKKTFLSLEH